MKSDERIINIEKLETTVYVSNLDGVAGEFFSNVEDVAKDDSTATIKDSIEQMIKSGVEIDRAMSGLEKFMKSIAEEFKETDEKIAKMMNAGAKPDIGTNAKRREGKNPYNDLV